MFGFKFFLAIMGINPVRAKKAVSEDERQVITLKQEEKINYKNLKFPTCDPQLLINLNLWLAIMV